MHQSEKELFAEAEKERKAREDEVCSSQKSSCSLFKSSLYILVNEHGHTNQRLQEARIAREEGERRRKERDHRYGDRRRRYKRVSTYLSPNEL